MKKKERCADIMAIIEHLQPGENVVYYTGESGWIGRGGWEPLYLWLDEMRASGKYEFKQRKVSSGFRSGQYEYIARRRMVAE